MVIIVIANILRVALHTQIGRIIVCVRIDINAGNRYRIGSAYIVDHF